MKLFVLFFIFFSLFSCYESSKNQLNGGTENPNNLTLDTNELKSLFGENEIDFNDIYDKIGKSRSENLEEFIFDNCAQIKSLNGIQKFKNVSHIRLNNISIDLINVLENLSKLNSLEIYNSKIQKFDLNYLPKTLESLTIVGSKIEKVESSTSNLEVKRVYLGGLPNWNKFVSKNFFLLIEITISNCSIENLSDVVQRLPASVKRLILAHNKISDLDLNIDFKSIVSINLFDNPVSKKISKDKIHSIKNESRENVIVFTFENPLE